MKQQYLIWDLPLRLFHWSLVVVISGLWYTSEQEGEMTELHMQLGYVALGLVCFRIIWGFLGTKHARFSQFIPKPTAVKAYIAPPSSAQQVKYAGHNPLGSLMVLLMLFLILLQAVSGLFITDDIFSSGPYYGSVEENVEAILSAIHHNGFWFISAAVVLHVIAVIYYVRVKKKDLITPMLTGKKPEDEINRGDAIPHSKLLVAAVVVVGVVGFVYWLVVYNAPVVEAYYF